jgi:hypothetical protein
MSKKQRRRNEKTRRHNANRPAPQVTVETVIEPQTRAWFNRLIDIIHSR